MVTPEILASPSASDLKLFLNPNPSSAKPPTIRLSPTKPISAVGNVEGFTFTSLGQSSGLHLKLNASVMDVIVIVPVFVNVGVPPLPVTRLAQLAFPLSDPYSNVMPSSCV